MDSDRDGFISADDLLHYLAVPSDACTHALFVALAKVTKVTMREGGREGGRESLVMPAPMRSSLPWQRAQ